MLGGKHKVLSTRIGNEVHPRLGIPVFGGEVTEEIIIHNGGPISIKLMIVDISLIRISMMAVPRRRKSQLLSEQPSSRHSMRRNQKHLMGHCDQGG